MARLVRAGHVLRSRSRLRITRIDGGTDAAIIDVTDGRFRDESPSFTPDGKYLAFLSNRSFDPVYDGHSFDLSFPSPIKPYLVALAADTPSPFGPSVDLEADADAERRQRRQRRCAGAQPPPSPCRPCGSTPRAWPTASSPSRCRKATTPSLTAAAGALLWLDSELAGTTGEGRASLEDKGARAEPGPLRPGQAPHLHDR